VIGAQTWTIKGGGVLGPAPFLLAGIVNITPDSFYDGGAHDTFASAVAHARSLTAEGADMLDLGGESTRPGAPEVTEAEELARVVPVLRELAADSGGGADSRLSPADQPDATPEDPALHAPVTPPVLAVDTYKARVAAAALEAGARVINDISACLFEPELLDVVAQYKPGYVLMHSQGRPGTMQRDPRYGNVVDEILLFFEERLHALTAAGVPEANIVLDPGIGFGKLLQHNLDILRGVERFGKLGRPVYMGLSNKTVWGMLLGLGPKERQNATAVATALLAARGVLVHRVHEVALARQAALVAQAITA